MGPTVWCSPLHRKEQLLRLTDSLVWFHFSNSPQQPFICLHASKLARESLHYSLALLLKLWFIFTEPWPCADSKNGSWFIFQLPRSLLSSEAAESSIPVAYPCKRLLQTSPMEEPGLPGRTKPDFSNQARKIPALILHSVFSVKSRNLLC